MIAIRSCCANILPNIRKDLLGRYLIYCPHCGLMRIHEEAIDTIDDETDWTLLDTIGMIIAKGIYYCDPARGVKNDRSL